MTTRRIAAWVAGVLLALPAMAHAQAPPAQKAPKGPVELSPFVSTGLSDSAGIGAAVRWPIGAKLALEAEAEFRHTDGRFNYDTADNDGLNGSLNLIFDLPRFGRVTPYLLGGGGLEHWAKPHAFGPYDLFGPPPVVYTQTGTSFVLNGGGGVRVGVTDRWGLRAEVRWSDGWAEGAPESVRIFYGATVGLGGGR